MIPFETIDAINESASMADCGERTVALR